MLDGVTEVWNMEYFQQFIHLNCLLYHKSVSMDVCLVTSLRSDDAGVFPACVEGGSVFAAGSALASRVACEQCFCLRGRRQCVRPSCLPPPPHCAPRPAPGACCPQRYYCDTTPDRPNQHTNRYGNDYFFLVIIM